LRGFDNYRQQSVDFVQSETLARIDFPFQKDRHS